MRYDFQCDGCPMGEGPGGVRPSCHHAIDFPMGKAPAIGKTIACPIDGCGGRLRRVVSSGIGTIVKGEAATKEFDSRRGMHVNLNGRDVTFEFVDHKHTDPAYQRKMQDLERRLGASGSGIGKAYRRESDGRAVVDVVSNVPDPLGKIEAAKRRGDMPSITRKINTPFKRRKK